MGSVLHAEREQSQSGKNTNDGRVDRDAPHVAAHRSSNPREHMHEATSPCAGVSDRQLRGFTSARRTMVKVEGFDALEIRLKRLAYIPMLR